MIDMLKRHAIRVLRQAGHEQADVTRLVGVGIRSVRRVEGEPDVTHSDDVQERERRAIGRPAKAEPFRRPPPPGGPDARRRLETLLGSHSEPSVIPFKECNGRIPQEQILRIWKVKVRHPRLHEVLDGPRFVTRSEKCSALRFALKHRH
jgi:hypothetical protein